MTLRQPHSQDEDLPVRDTAILVHPCPLASCPASAARGRDGDGGRRGCSRLWKLRCCYLWIEQKNQSVAAIGDKTSDRFPRPSYVRNCADSCLAPQSMAAVVERTGNWICMLARASMRCSPQADMWTFQLTISGLTRPVRAVIRRTRIYHDMYRCSVMAALGHALHCFDVVRLN